MNLSLLNSSLSAGWMANYQHGLCEERRSAAATATCRLELLQATSDSRSSASRASWATGGPGRGGSSLWFPLGWLALLHLGTTWGATVVFANLAQNSRTALGSSEPPVPVRSICFKPRWWGVRWRERARGVQPRQSSDDAPAHLAVSRKMSQILSRQFGGGESGGAAM